MFTLQAVTADVWMCDNDGTLYTSTKKLSAAVTQRMLMVVAAQYHVPLAGARELRRRLMRQHSAQSTLVALHRDGKVDIPDVIRQTYLAVPLERGVLEANHLLFSELKSVSGEKEVLTNNPAGFADRILRCLGSRNLFSRITGIEENAFMEKPDPCAFARIVAHTQSGRKVCYVDDKEENVVAAVNLGCTGVLWDQEHHQLRRIS